MQAEAMVDHAQAISLGIAEFFDPKAGLLEKLRERLRRLPAATPGENEPMAADNPELMMSLFGAPILE